MNKALKAIIIYMLNKRCIGGKHTSEEYLIRSKLRWLHKADVKIFHKEYKEILNNQLLLRIKKRTGKSYDWHISLNPKRLKELYDLLK
jgi:hypothetical protein